MLTQHGVQNRTQSMTGAPAMIALSDCARFSNPRQIWRGFFVDYSFYFGFFGDCQLPACAGAMRMPG
jgi:hypothetical protein